MYFDHGRGAHPHGYFSPLSRPSKIVSANSNTHKTMNKKKGDMFIDGQYESLDDNDDNDDNNNDNDNDDDEYSTDSTDDMSQSQTKEKQRQTYRKHMSIVAEVLNIVRPVVYVSTYMSTGMDDSNWLPFYASLSLDLASNTIHMLRGCSERSKQELKRRRTYWLMYLLRPPFFQKYVKYPLDSVADSLKILKKKTLFKYFKFLHKKIYFIMFYVFIYSDDSKYAECIPRSLFLYKCFQLLNKLLLLSLSNNIKKNKILLFHFKKCKLRNAEREHLFFRDKHKNY
ncbi:hypothetical protein RFI_31364 [Reticulomyxa filosa]|uniref:Peroxisomal membrane protein PEX16 n=1 Tax=Reticulomyxa filosa TaxID=46433 RepID=X6LY06_RETFI|nr:hypothetical protein RFI_31364 [Reticulomyxa filosa]|eukprot:ETO06032.1 hypothetical protein RFI_31364 [Reticulomyxa filosa]